MRAAIRSFLRVPIIGISFVGKAFSQGAAFGAGAAVAVIYIFAAWYRPLADFLATIR